MAPRLTDEVFGTRDHVNPVHLIARALLFIGLAVPVLALAREPESCYPNCRVTVEEVVAAQSSLPAGETSITVAFYGDSRGVSFAEGAKLVSGWVVTNWAVDGCGWRYQHPGAQEFGDRLPCATEKYIPQSGHHQLAIVYAGTLLAQDKLVLGLTDQQMVDNLVSSLRLIDADSIIVLATPTIYGPPPDSALADPVAMAAMDANLAQAVALLSAEGLAITWLPEFAEYVNALPRSCQPDGGHFTTECAKNAGDWIKATIGGHSE